MSKRTWLFSWLFVALISFVTVSAGALEPSIWINQGTATKTLIKQNVVETVDEKFCDKHTEYELQYTVILGKRISAKRTPIEACWYTTSYGLIGLNVSHSILYIKEFNRSDAVVRVPYHSFLWTSLGETNAMAYRYNRSSFSRSLYVYDDISSRLTLYENGTYDSYTIDRESNVWKLQDQYGNLVGVNAIGHSQNGEWMAVEGGVGFFRLNVRTKEVLMFDGSMFGYGYGLNPHHELAISNDGRYAVVGGGAFGMDIAYVYDLSTCVPKADRLAVATGCGKRDFKKEFFPSMPVNQGPFRFEFSNDSESLITNIVNQAGKIDKYLVTAPGKEVHLMDYLALGDSYSSGEGEYDGDQYYVPGTDGNGITLPDWQTNLIDFPYYLEKCHLSTRSYPYNLARNGGLIGNQFRSVACSGSKANDLTNVRSTGDVSSRYNGRYDQYVQTGSSDLALSKTQSVNNFIPGRAAQIEFVKKYKPKVVTIGIGGNDIGFASKLEACLFPGTCDWEGSLRYSLGVEIQDLYGTLHETYMKLSEAGPTTKFYIVGYPQILSLSETCSLNVRLNFNERVMAQEMISYINATVKNAAQSVGFTYLDIENALLGKQMCDVFEGDKAVRGVLIGNDIFGIFGNESFHPTHVGHARIAETITAQMGNQSVIEYQPCALLGGLRCPVGEVAEPPIPSYFSAYATDSSYKPERVIKVDSLDYTYQVGELPGLRMGEQQSIHGPQVNGSVQRLAPGQSNQITMYSTPQQVGTLMTDGDGNVSGQITIPEDTEPGYHTIVINTKDSVYQDMTLYQQIFVYDSIDDLDGDGTPNDQEKCGMLEPANQDEDRDGIDDGCDGIIDVKPDTTPPVITPQLSQQANSNGWHGENVTITWTVSDDIDTELSVPAQVVVDNEGEHTYTSSEVCDTAGNCTTGSVTIKLDKTAPQITPTISDAASDSGWFNHYVVVEWSAQDNFSDVISPPAVAANQEGQHEYHSSEVCDLAGNCATGSMVVQIDKTSPLLTLPAFSRNPKSVTETSQLSLSVREDHSGIKDAEYFIGDDPGLGNGATLSIDNGNVHTTYGTDFGTGVYKITARVQDNADNWSAPVSDYLVVYDATSGVRLRGARTIDLRNGDNQLPWADASSFGQGVFAFSVRYGAYGVVTPQSDFQFSYKTGTQCNNPAKAVNCHSFELNATQIEWLITTGPNQAAGIFRGEGTLKTDTLQRAVSFVVSAQDGERVSPVATDLFELTLYDYGAGYGSAPAYFVAPHEVGRGNIKLKF